MTVKNGTYKMTVEHRITKLEETVKTVSDDVVEIRDNHLKHLSDDIVGIKSQMWWGIGVAITVLMGVIVDLALRLM